MAVRPDLKKRLVRAAGELLATTSTGAMAKALSPDAVASTTGSGDRIAVSRPTAYRAWSDRNEAVVDVARHFSDPDVNGVDLHLEKSRKKYRQVVTDGRTLDMARLTTAFRQLLSERFHQQFTGVSTPAGWVLHGAAMSSSAVWRGPRPPSRDLEATGRQILTARGELYDHLTEGWSRMTSQIWAAAGRRPRRGLSVEKIVMLTQSLFDGCVLRTFIDPQLNDPEIGDDRRHQLLDEAIDLVVDAIFELTWAFTEPDGLTDPRRPAAHPAAGFFDRVVTAAASLYDDRRPEAGPGPHPELVPVGMAAEAAGLSPEVAAILFADPADLADSVVRHLVTQDGPPGHGPDAHEPMADVQAVLRRLSDVRQTHPRALVAAQVHPPTQPRGAVPFLDELTAWIARVLDATDADRPEPLKIAHTLRQLVLAGDGGWSGVEAILTWLGTTGPTGRGGESVTSAHAGPA